MDEQIPLGVELLGLRGEFLRGEGCQTVLDLGVFGFFGKVVPFVRVFIKIIEFLIILSVSDVAPVLVDDRIFSRMHMGKENGAVFGFVRGG